MPDRPDWIVVGLGNPGKEYENTRHNIGFRVVDGFAKESGSSLICRYHNSQVGLAKICRGGDIHKVLLCKPQTYMNNSGEAVAAIAEDFSIDLNRILVVVDDFALPLGSLRIRRRGSSGGHNGLKSINEFLDSESYPRLRIGIGREDAGEFEDTVDFVLGNFDEFEESVLIKVISNSTSLIFDWVEKGLEYCQNEYNNRDFFPPMKED